MGIEPTRDIVVPRNGFEDRGRHQVAGRLPDGGILHDRGRGVQFVMGGGSRQDEAAGCPSTEKRVSRFSETEPAFGTHADAGLNLRLKPAYRTGAMATGATDGHVCRLRSTCAGLAVVDNAGPGARTQTHVHASVDMAPDGGLRPPASIQKTQFKRNLLTVCEGYKKRAAVDRSRRSQFKKLNSKEAC